MTEPFLPEFSRVFHLEKGLTKPVQFNAKADEEECVALAKRFELLDIKNFSVTFVVEASREAGEYEVKGSGQADVVQACVVTLKDVPEHVDFSFHTKLVHGVEKPLDEGDYSFLEEEIDVDYYQNSHVDLGEIAAQYLTLSLNPYPRAEDVDTSQYIEKDEEVNQASVFNLLQKLKS